MAAHWLNRRAFLTGLGCMGVAACLPKLSADERLFGVRRVRGYSGSGIALPAVAAACMPETLVITHSSSGLPMRGQDFQERLGLAGFVELRTYHFDREESLASVRKAFARYGIRPLLTGADGAFLFVFDTLASRERAWRELSAEPEWLELRAELRDLAIYHVPRLGTKAHG